MALLIRDVVEKLMEPINPIEDTVDTLKIGDPTAEVKGIVTTFMATYHVIQQTIEKGANLLITHEPTFYNHKDEIESLQNDPVYQEKRRLIEESGLAIFRFHDYWHHYKPDGIMEGFIRALEWESYVIGGQQVTLLSKPTPLNIPTMTVMEIAEYIKSKLDVPFVRIVGDLSMKCTRIGLLPGYGGIGARAIPFYQSAELDLIITGEGPEWETPEYVRDAVDQGKKRALIVLGHLKSEEAGMRYLATWMRTMFSGVPIEFISEKQPFHVL